MALIRCPRCELNYMREEEKICSVCRREVRGEGEHYEVIELCSECGEHPAVSGSELCAYCIKELSRRVTSTDEPVEHEGATIEIDSVSTMDEIDLDLGDDLEGEEFADEEELFEEEEIDYLEADSDDDDDDLDED